MSDVITGDNPGPDWLAPQYEITGKVPSVFMVSTITNTSDADYGGGLLFFDGVKDWDHFAGGIGWGGDSTRKWVYLDAPGVAGWQILLDDGGHTSIPGALTLPPVAAPAAPASGSVIYVDSADGVLKAKNAAGVVHAL